MIKIAFGLLAGAWLIIGSFAIAEKIATKRHEKRQQKIAKKLEEQNKGE